VNLRKYLIAMLAVPALQSAVLANGVVVGDASKGIYARLQWSNVRVDVESQVSVTITTQQFMNTAGKDLSVAYAFPLPAGASATRLRWREGSTWYMAVFAAQPQDSSLPGSGTTMAAGLKTYLGAKPLYFTFPRMLKSDSSLTVELSYVELLPYKYGSVTYQYPNDYHLIQSTPLDSQKLAFSLTSQRTIESLRLATPSGGIVSQGTNAASLLFERNSRPADTNYIITYALRTTELGLFSFSTKPSDSLGYFTLVVEPNLIGTEIIKKNFAIIIDRSGSMGGTKMIQAINAATYIVNNMNEGDWFTLVDFDDVITSFRDGLVPYTTSARDSARVYVAGLTARNSTDIASAFKRTIPYFSVSPDSVANIIVFLTDGQATAGQTNSDSILAIVSQSAKATGKSIYIFTFGIGSDVNQQLLTLIASQNKGLAEFLGNDQLESRITDFYNTIRNPVIISPSIAFSSSAVSEPYPNPLPNLYKGQQMLVSGVYTTAQSTTVTFSGTSFGKPVSYQYELPLVDTLVERYAFLPKIWAKLKIEFLLVKFYSAPAGSALAMELKNEIISVSIKYGVVSPFTSFTGGPATGVEEVSAPSTVQLPAIYKLLGNYPNPFNAGTVILFRVSKPLNRPVSVKIYNSVGQLVRILTVMVHGEGEYSVHWDGTGAGDLALGSGVYFYLIDFGDAILGERMVLIK